MPSHNQRHTILGSDHLPGISPPAGSGKANVVVTTDDSRLDQITVEAVNQATPVGGEIVRRNQQGHVTLPVTNATGNQAISVSQAQTLLVGGMYRGAVDNVVPDHTSDDVTGLKVGSMVIETGSPTSSESVWRVTDVSAGSTGSLVTWTDTGVPTADIIYVNLKTGGQWMYSVDRGTWIDMGASSHNRVHDINSPFDHSVPVNAYGIVFTAAGGVNILSMVNGDTGYPNVPLGAPLLSNGNGEPMYGGLLIASAVAQGSTVDPTVLDVASWPNNTVGVVRTTVGRFVVFKESSASVFAAELGQV